MKLINNKYISKIKTYLRFAVFNRHINKKAFKLYFAISILALFWINSTLAQSTGFVLKKNKAPNFEIVSDNGTIIRLSDLKGKVILINFFSTSCGLCRQELPSIQEKIWDKYKNNPDFLLLVIACGNSENDIIKYKTTNSNITLPIYPDIEKKIFLKYAKYCLPRNYIIDRNGMIIYDFVGYYENQFEKMVNFIHSLLSKI